jgi:hypothetical protein
MEHTENIAQEGPIYVPLCATKQQNNKEYTAEWKMKINIWYLQLINIKEVLKMSHISVFFGIYYY